MELKGKYMDKLVLQITAIAHDLPDTNGVGSFIYEKKSIFIISPKNNLYIYKDTLLDIRTKTN
jgi:hypothetical protein